MAMKSEPMTSAARSRGDIGTFYERREGRVRKETYIRKEKGRTLLAPAPFFFVSFVTFAVFVFSRNPRSR
jgi:hypothetical protein